MNEAANGASRDIFPWGLILRCFLFISYFSGKQEAPTEGQALYGATTFWHASIAIYAMPCHYELNCMLSQNQFYFLDCIFLQYIRLLKQIRSTLSKKN